MCKLQYSPVASCTSKQCRVVAKEAVIKAGDDAVASEGRYLPPCCVGALTFKTHLDFLAS
ncbi:hypothetical protein T08_6916 [Trichinella sp. T8]|nr:hypothetical protein T08_6916 [Trichinella sp. T8]